MLTLAEIKQLRDFIEDGVVKRGAAGCLDDVERIAGLLAILKREAALFSKTAQQDSDGLLKKLKQVAAEEEKTRRIERYPYKEDWGVPIPAVPMPHWPPGPYPPGVNYVGDFPPHPYPSTAGGATDFPRTA